MAIKNLNWDLETTFTREQVIAMAKVAEFIGNIEKDLTAGFPSAFKDFDWGQVRKVMALFAELERQDGMGCRSLVKAVNDVNAGRVQLMCGKVVPVSPFEVGEKVKCINSDGTLLVYGSLYVVGDYCTDGVRLEGFHEMGWFDYSRFVRARKSSKGE